MMKSSGVNLATVLNLTRNMPFLTPLMFKYAKLANMVKKSSTRIACILKTGKKYAKVSANAFATAALAMIAAPKMKMFVVRKPAYLPKADFDISIGAAGDDDSAADFGEAEHDEHDENAAYGVGRTLAVPNCAATIAGRTKIPAPTTILMEFETRPQTPISLFRPSFFSHRKFTITLPRAVIICGGESFSPLSGSVTVYLAQTIRCLPSSTAQGHGASRETFPDGRAMFTAKALASLSLEERGRKNVMNSNE